MKGPNNIRNEAKIRITDIHRRAGKEFNVSNISEKQYNFEFDLFRDDQRVKVLVYFGKKGVRALVQGNQNTALYSQAEELLSDQTSLNFSAENPAEPKIYIGSDESGKGDYFGPLVVAAFSIDVQVREALPISNIRDSKELTDNQINSIAGEIKKAAPGYYEIISLPPKKYNAAYENFGNLNLMLESMHHSAIARLLERSDAKRIIIDKFTPKRMNKFETMLNNGIEISTIEKAEKYTAVACASILARSEFNTWFKETESDGIILPKGSSNGIEYAAEKYFKGNAEELAKYAKLHFKTTKKIKLF